MRKLLILGSTGSVGTQALDIVRANPDRFQVVGLAAGGGNPGLFAEQAAEFGAARLATGADEAATMIREMDADVVLNAITGSIGLGPTLAALECGRTLALANKESLVAGGALVTKAAAPGQIVPVDSEHSALAQALRSGTHDEVAKLVLTASGGPFRGRQLADLEHVTAAQALAHPTWAMGPVVTLNSATLVNKGLELIEAHLLFDIPYDRIDVVVHPQSIIHSMVTFTDGSTLAQASPPDMKLPIALGLGWPDRIPGAAAACDFSQAQSWTFEPVDHRTFPALNLARRAGELGGRMPAIYNAANEELVAAFLSGNLSFPSIANTLERILEISPAEFLEDASAIADVTAAGDLGAENHCYGTGTFMLIAIGVILFALGLLFSIAWHELGHLTFAKLFKVRTTQYMVGFGKTIWSRRRGETEYGLKAVPLGGYIRMVGMVPPAKAGARFRAPTTTAQGPFGVFRQMVEDTRRTDREQVIEEIDDGRQFYQLHPFKRIIIMFAGPFMNLVLAVVLFGIVLVGFGVPTPVPTVQAVSQCIISAEVAQTRTDCLPTDPLAPAAEAGLQSGDRFISIDGVPIENWDQLRSIISTSDKTSLTVVLERNGADISTTIPVVQTVRNVYDENDKVIGQETVGVIGVAPQTPYISQSPVVALQTTGAFIGRAATAVVQIPSRIPALWDAIFSGEPRDLNTPVGIVGAGRISGEILDLDTGATDKIVLFLQLLAGFNMSLFLINLLPLLPLDGGHILGAVIEWIRRGFAKIAKRPDPGPFDVAKLMPVAYVVALLFIGLTVLTLVADVVNPVKLFG